MNRHPTEILKPIRHRFILLTFLIAIILELIPLPYGSMRWLPDFIGILMLYWVIHEPDQVNIGSAFVLGLMTDLINANLFGQHALTYSIAAYLAFKSHRRITMYNLQQQTLVVLGLLLVQHIIMLITRLLMGASLSGWGYFLPPLTGALLWPILTRLMLITYHITLI